MKRGVWFFIAHSILFISVTAAYAGGITIPVGASLKINTATFNVPGNITNLGTLLLTSGTLTLTGNWTNSGTFTAGTGTVNFTGSGGTQTLTGSTTFYNLTKSVTSSATLTFDNTATQTVTNSLTLNGAPGQLLFLRSDSTGVQNNLTLQAGGSQSLSYLNVKDSDASGGLQLVAGSTSTNSGNNINWLFGGASSITDSGLFSFDSQGQPKVGTWDLSANGVIVLTIGAHSLTITVNKSTGEVTMQ